MKYDHSIERSAELLRRALPLMSRQAAALHPVSYAVWYAYAAEEPAALHRAVDAHLARHGTLDEAATQALYRQYLADLDSDTAIRMADGMQRVLTGMSDSAAAASDRTAQFGQSLERIGAEIPAAPTAAIDELREHTAQMHAAMGELQQRLDASRKEIDGLRDEVRRARHESLVDGLTGLANRRAFDQRLVAIMNEVATDPAAPRPCLVMTDIDHFKRINDRYGHAFGDQVLKAVAQVLQSVAPEQALAARVGGEEFAVLLPAAPIAEAGQIAERLRVAIAASRIRRRGDDESIERVTASFGVAPYRDGESPADFFDRADRALYQSKAAGRDRVTLVQ